MDLHDVRIDLAFNVFTHIYASVRFEVGAAYAL